MAEEQKKKEETAAEEGEKPKSKRKLILAVVALLVLAGGGAGAYFFLMGGSPEDTAEHHGEDHGEDAEKMAAAKEAEKKNEMHVVMPFREIIVNITTLTAKGQATTRFLKLNIAIVYDPEVPGAENLGERQIYIRDSYVDYLRQLTEADLRGSAGLAALKAELLHRARLLADTDAPQELLIADLVIQ